FPETYKVTGKTKLSGITGVRLEVLTDPSLPMKGPGRSPTNGNLVLSEFSVTAQAEGSTAAATAVGLHKAQATFSQEGFNVAAAKRTPQEKAILEQAYLAQDRELARLRQEVADHAMPVDPRQPGAQDLVWALLNSKAFQFNH